MRYNEEKNCFLVKLVSLFYFIKFFSISSAFQSSLPFTLEITLHLSLFTLHSSLHFSLVTLYFFLHSLQHNFYFYFILLNYELSDWGPEHPAILKGYKIRSGAKQTQLTLPKGGPNRTREYLTKPKKHCNACWHPIARPYTHKHCKEALNNPVLQEPILHLTVKIHNT